MDILKGDKKAKRTFMILKTLFILSGILQGISVILTIPLFEDLLKGNFNIAGVWFISIGMIALGCFMLNYIGMNIGNHMSVWEVCDNKTREVGSSIIKLPLGWFDASSKGKISKAISTDINTIGHYTPMVLPEILTVLSSSAVIGIALIMISLKYAVIIMLMLPLMVRFWKKNAKVLMEVEDENVKANQKMESVVIEFAQLQPILRAAGVLLSGWYKLDNALIEDRNATIKTLTKKGKNTFAYMLVVNIGTILILALSAVELKNGSIETGAFLGILVAMFRFANPLAGLLGYLSETFNINSALKRVNSIIDAPKLPETTVDKKIIDNNGISLAFKEVDFSYIEGRKVLQNINLDIPANAITALVGDSGSGKSTINKLIARFWDVDCGEILINGINIKEIRTDKLMSLISMVFQEVYLFNTTIKENLLIANPNATEEEIVVAAKKSRLDKVIERLPNGWDTIVGEGGNSLSGGEKQRVSIARAFLKDAPILLLDEITSALDGVNESMITKSLEELSKNKTVVVIAHRLSSIKKADKIAVIDEGKVIACDKHEELLKTNRKYQDFWNALRSSKTWRL